MAAPFSWGRDRPPEMKNRPLVGWREVDNAFALLLVNDTDTPSSDILKGARSDDGLLHALRSRGKLSTSGDKDFCVGGKFFQTDETADKPLIVIDLHTTTILLLALTFGNSATDIPYGRPIPEESCSIEQTRSTISTTGTLF